MSKLTTHILYIFTYDDVKKQQEDKKMLDLLAFIDSNIKTINAMGIKIETRRYSQKQLISNSALLTQIRKEGITFPSICTPGKNYDGFKNIENLYIKNIELFKQFEHKQEKPLPVANDDGKGELEDYMRSAIDTKNDGDDDEESESLSGGKGLNAQVSAALAARNTKNPSKPIRGVTVQQDPPNVRTNRESMQQTISRLRNPQQVEAGGIRGGGITEDDGPGDADSFKDDMMLRARAENEDSLQLSGD